jgi:hypothetical protein
MARPRGSAARRTTSPDATPSDDGLGGEVPVKELALALQNADLENGAIVRYVESVDRENREFNRRQKMHVFEFGAAQGNARFSLWGSMQLDQKLREVGAGAIVMVQYQGRGVGDRAPHNWIVRPFHGTTQQLSELVKRYERGNKQAFAALETAKRQRGLSSEANDEDLPF